MSLPEYCTIGAHSYYADLCVHRWGDEKISIGKWCAISQGVKLLAGGNHRTDAVSAYPFDTMLLKTAANPMQDRSYEKGGGIEIQNDVWIGYGATICGHVKVGHGAVIAANATVFTDVPAYGIAVGNPARVTKYRFDEKTVEALLRIAWWQWPESTIRLHLEHGAFYWPIAAFVKQFDPIGAHVIPEVVHA
jgi:acetyltransferase-like isoleucine patch superfamily enzyme